VTGGARSPESSRLIVVRASRDIFTAILGSRGRWPPNTAAMVDRRERERRIRLRQVLLERRHHQRRAEPHPFWHRYGFIVVETTRLPIHAIHLDAAADLGEPA
jgi:hypothetical protein